MKKISSFTSLVFIFILLQCLFKHLLYALMIIYSKPRRKKYGCDFLLPMSIDCYIAIKMVLILYGIEASPPVRAVHMVINKLNICDVEYIQINPLQGDQNSESFLKMNPQHCIPTLKDDNFVIWDSHAINAYLVSMYADDDILYPAELKQRAIIDQRLHFDSSILFPALRQSIRPIFFAGINSFEKESLDNITAAYDLIEKFLIHPWLAGDDLTLADICCYATISTLNLILPIDPELFSNLWDWLKRCSEMDFIKKANENGLSMFKDILKSKLA